jgi:hypothetical protein
MADRNSIIEKIKALLSKTTENGCTEVVLALVTVHELLVKAPAI